MDKIKHFGACFSIAIIVGALFGPVAGFVLAMAVGIGKEERDRRRAGVFGWMDIAADASGAGLDLSVFVIFPM